MSAYRRLCDREEGSGRPVRTSRATGPTGLVFFPAFDWAISPTHPEREERLLYTRDQVFEEGLLDLPQLIEYRPRLAADDDVARAHFCIPSIEAQCTEAHRVAAGSTLVLADALVEGEIANGFALVRPPGHHAMRVVYGNRGFCNINNMAIMVEYLRTVHGHRRIAIVDTDVHHGDGTQDIFWNDPDILFISFHQDGRTLYPGSGFMEELGGPNALGTTINIPLPPGTPDEGIHFVLDELVLPILDDFTPELVLNSAGQDNHFSDPLANMRFSAQGYARLNETLRPDLCVLEGGYAVETALPYVNTAIIQAMAGLDYSHVIEPGWEPGRFALESSTRQVLASEVSHLLGMWRQRDRLVQDARAKLGEHYRRRRTIFYDTDMIEEDQEEVVRLCPDCPGFVALTTQAKQGHGRLPSAFCVSIPIRACSTCCREATAAFMEQKVAQRYDYVLLQDRLHDRYERYPG
ncbi:MAG: histone deacetylase [Thermoleophilia bacterium]|jgi:acetoin utilization deacetylase AcuC-like enzyme